MSRILAIVIAYALFAGLSATHAARDTGLPVNSGPNLEMVVLEVDGCIYCGVFRRQLLPAYQASRHGRAIPVRFVDINDEALARIGLTQPVGMVPTFVVLENNEEIGRIPGLMGHADFFRALDVITAGRLDN